MSKFAIQNTLFRTLQFFLLHCKIDIIFFCNVLKINYVLIFFQRSIEDQFPQIFLRNCGSIFHNFDLINLIRSRKVQSTWLRWDRWVGSPCRIHIGPNKTWRLIGPPAWKCHGTAESAGKRQKIKQIIKNFRWKNPAIYKNGKILF